MALVQRENAIRSDPSREYHDRRIRQANAEIAISADDPSRVLNVRSAKWLEAVCTSGDLAQEKEFASGPDPRLKQVVHLSKHEGREDVRPRIRVERLLCVTVPGLLRIDRRQ